MLENLNRNGSTVTSGYLLVHTHLTTYTRDGGISGTAEAEVEVWFDGVRARVEIRRRDEDEEPETWCVFDGERVIETHPPTFPRARMATPTDLRELGRYGISIPLVSLLMRWPLDPVLSHLPPLGTSLQGREGQSVRVEGPASVGDSLCHLIVVPPLPGESDTQTTERLWACPEKDWAIVKRETDTQVLSAREVSRVHMVDEAREWLHPIDGLWLPKAVVSTRYYTDSATGREQIVRTHRSEVLSVSFNTPIPDDVFTLHLPETTELRPRGE